MDFVFSLPIGEALSLIQFACEKQEEELLFSRWVNGPQFQMSFDEFKQKLKPPQFKKDEEILDEVKQILTLFERRGKDGDI